MATTRVSPSRAKSRATPSWSRRAADETRSRNSFSHPSASSAATWASRLASWSSLEVRAYPMSIAGASSFQIFIDPVERRPRTEGIGLGLRTMTEALGWPRLRLWKMIHGSIAVSRRGELGSRWRPTFDGLGGAAPAQKFGTHEGAASPKYRAPSHPARHHSGQGSRHHSSPQAVDHPSW